MDDGAWWATVLGVTKRQTRLSMHTSGVLTPETEQWGSLKNGWKVTSTKQTLSSSDARASDLEATQTSLHSNISLYEREHRPAKGQGEVAVIWPVTGRDKPGFQIPCLLLSMISLYLPQLGRQQCCTYKPDLNGSV